MAEPLLVELLTEELPPKSLRVLSEAFADKLALDLAADRFLPSPAGYSSFATPRRLAVLIGSVNERSADSEREVQGPPVSAPPQAVSGFAKKNGVSVEALKTAKGPKGEVYVAHVRTSGLPLTDILAGKVAAALRSLPIQKVMRWGSGDAQFVRPVHGLVMLHGNKVVPGTVLGLSSRNRTLGHRFMSRGEVTLPRAEEYAEVMGRHSVIADFRSRKAAIDDFLRRESSSQNGSLGEYQTLLDEVTALVEHPSVYVGSFDAGFLSVPQECLILTMRQNQKYFPLFDPSGKLLPKFLIVSNMQVADPKHIIGGNERVVRPRLEDARFFYDQDRKTRLEERVPQLAKVVYHNKLGSQLERVERIQLLAGHIARALGANPAPAERAAWLAKADLITGMVGEFPELQGTMGRYYALHDGEPNEVADAIEAHYRPRFAGDQLPDGPTACAVALADKLDSLAGLFGIGQQPTGEKDPFGLRRSALGVIRILVEQKLDLPLRDLVDAAFKAYGSKVNAAQDDLAMFVYDRFAGYLKDLGFTTLQVDAVLSQRPDRLYLVPQQLEAVKAFQALPEAESLAAANKRVANILKQAAAKGESSFAGTEFSNLQEPAEKALHEAIGATKKKADAHFKDGAYADYLKSFAVLKVPVDTFFDKVMVMVDDANLRRARLALLHDLREAMNRVADISKLAQ
jgi:glycyl-tRNA synthetase beta chain